VDAFTGRWDSIHPEVVAAISVLGALYLAAWLPRARRGLPVPAGIVLAFLGGLTSLGLALNGPLHDLAERALFSAHMVQHLVLTLLVPPLLLAGTPAWMVDRLLGPLLDGRRTGPVTRAFSHPLLQFAIYAITLVAWHLPGPYDAALARAPWHALAHATLLGASLLGWWPVLARSRRAPALPPAAQLLYLFVFGMPMTIVAAMITGAEDVLYPFYASAPRVFDLSPLADQRLGGVLMWVPAGVVPLVVFTLVFFRWAAAEADADERA
jgi:putative membrane protein